MNSVLSTPATGESEVKGSRRRRSALKRKRKRKPKGECGTGKREGEGIESGLFDGEGNVDVELGERPRFSRTPSLAPSLSRGVKRKRVVENVSEVVGAGQEDSPAGQEGSPAGRSERLFEKGDTISPVVKLDSPSQ